jgi:ribosome-associated protein
MIPIMAGVSISEDEIHFDASRSGGPGGQNVNKVSSRVTLTFDVNASAALSEDQKRTVLQKLGGRINKEGVLRVISQRTRSQEMNRADAAERFAELIREALTPQRTRVKTRVTRAARQRRVDEKKKRALVKKQRNKPRIERI